MYKSIQMNDNNDSEGGSGMPRDLFERRWVRVMLFGLVPLVVFLLVCAGINVSQLGIDHTIVVMSQKQLVSGGAAAMRITLISDGEGFFLPDRLTGHLVLGNDRHLLFDGDVYDDGYALARNYQVPLIQAGPATLEIDVRFDSRRRIVRSPVEIVDRAPAMLLELPADVAAGQGPSRVTIGDRVLQIVPEDRGAFAGLHSALFIRAQDATKAPVEIPVRLSLPPSGAGEKPVVVEGRTDAAGLMEFIVKPFDMVFPIEVLTDDVAADGAADSDTPADTPADTDSDSFSAPVPRLYPPVVYGGIHAKVEEPIWDGSAPLEVDVAQITSGGPVYVDLFRGGQWIYAGSGWAAADGRASFSISDPPVGLLRVQVTNGVLGFGKTVAVRHIYVLDSTDDPSFALKEILDRLEDPDDVAWARFVKGLDVSGMPEGFRQRLSAFALARLYKGHGAIPRLVSSRIEDDAELAAFKKSFQNALMGAILLLGVAVALLIGIIAHQAHQRQAHVTRMILEEALEVDREVAWQFQESPGAVRRRVAFQIAVLFMVIIGAFVAIALLVQTLSWGA